MVSLGCLIKLRPQNYLLLATQFQRFWNGGDFLMEFRQREYNTLPDHAHPPYLSSPSLQFRTLTVEEYRLALRNLEFHYQDFLRDNQDSQLFGADDRMQVESGYKKASQHYEGLLHSVEKGECWTSGQVEGLYSTRSSIKPCYFLWHQCCTLLCTLCCTAHLMSCRCIFLSWTSWFQYSLLEMLKFITGPFV